MRKTKLGCNLMKQNKNKVKEEYQGIKSSELSDEEVIEKAYLKAVRSGWKTSIIYDDMYGELVRCVDGKYIGVPYKQMIFDHKFAQSFWKGGQDENVIREVVFPSKYLSYARQSKIKYWEFHLQNMVLFKEPLDYIRKFIYAK